jgi:galactokinase
VPVVRAPGRVNLIGDHTDYQDGWCLPMAIDRTVNASFTIRSDGRVHVHSRELEGTVELPADGSVDPRHVEPQWGRSVAAALAVLAERGREPVGFDAVVTSTVPVGSGLSSSAAFAVAIVRVAVHVAEFAIERRELALAAQTVEHRATGVPCGVMDQMASVFGVADHALLLDCSTLAVEPVAIPPEAAILVAHSGVPRRLADSEYAARRAGCERAAARLGIRTLRDATLADVRDDPLARHVVTENARVAAFCEALRHGALEDAGALMLESHASLRDDFAVSTPELDALVARFVAAGAYGARVTGAGFGGCVVALGTQDSARSIAAATGSRIMRAATGARIE